MVVRSLDFGGGAVAAGGTIDLTLEFVSRGPANVAQGARAVVSFNKSVNAAITATNPAISCSRWRLHRLQRGERRAGRPVHRAGLGPPGRGRIRQPHRRGEGQLQPVRPGARQRGAQRQRADLVDRQPRAHAVDLAEPAPGGWQRHHPADRHQQRSVPRRQRRDLRHHPGGREPRLGQRRVQPRRRLGSTAPWAASPRVPRRPPRSSTGSEGSRRAHR